MSRRLRMTGVVLLVAAVGAAAVAWVGLGRLSGGVRASVVRPATTREVDQAGVRWETRFSSPINVAGLFGSDRWYVALGAQRGGDVADDARILLGDIPTGKVRAEARVPAPLSGPAVQSGKLLYASTGDSGCSAVDLDTGQTIWTTDVGDSIKRMATAGGRVFAAGRRRVSALDDVTGRILWTRSTDEEIQTSAAANDRCVCFGLADDSLLALDARSGERLFSVPLRSTPRGDVAIDGESAFVVVVSDDRPADVALTAIDLSNGRARWTFKWLDSLPPSTFVTQFRPAATAGPTVGGGLACLSVLDSMCGVEADTGKLRWQWRPIPARGDRPAWNAESPVGPAGFRDGAFYAAWRDHLSALDATTGREFWRLTMDGSYRPTDRTTLPPAFGNRMAFAPIGAYQVVAVPMDAGRPARESVATDVHGVASFWLVAGAGGAVGVIGVAVLLRRWRALTALASAGLCAVVVLAWHDSYRAAQFVGQRQSPRPGTGQEFCELTTRGVSSARGSLTVGATHAVWSSTLPPPALAGDPTVEWLHTRFALADDATATDSGDLDGLTRFSWTRQSRPSGTALGEQCETTLTIPHWTAAAMFGMIPVAWLAGWRDRRRYPNGRCAGCGYDLRGGQLTCPECGREVAS